MSDPTHAEYEALPLEAARRVDRVCDRFERACQAGRRPRVEDFLAEVGEPERPALYAELLLLDGRYGDPNGGQSTDPVFAVPTAAHHPAGAVPPCVSAPEAVPQAIGKY